MMHDISIRAGHLATIAPSFRALEGPRPIQLSFMISKILTEVDAAHGVLLEQLRPFFADDGTIDTEIAEVREILNDTVTISVPVITVDTLQQAGLMVSDDVALAFLIARGIVTSG